ncbi:MAG: hypothetical protein ACR2K2_00545 [Mycobacteriales bacterium]
MSGELVRREEVGEVVGRLTEGDLDRAERGRLLVRLTALLAGGARAAGARAALTGTWLTSVVADVALHIPVRDLATLSGHHDGHTGDALAEELVRTASLATAGVGAAGGALAAVQLAAPPTLLAAPVQLAAETVAVVAIELKLVAELHVVYGKAPLAPKGQVAAAYLSAWAAKRGIDPAAGLPGLGVVLGTAARQQLRRRVVRRLGRNLSTMAPFLAGAVAGAELNRRETRSLGESLIGELRRR